MVKIDFVRKNDYNVYYIYVAQNCLKAKRFIMEYLSVKQTAEKWGISSRRLQILCAQDRIVGAMRVGKYWAIPSDAKKPKDERIKSGRYIKTTKEKAE